uniref:Fatty acid hydroxylase domain-containing protein n=1 Tax=Chrysotila carterae TaxID=13221 RepID=A0A7S4BVG9_CHRCT|mmetsp:Transcript_33432/g.70354  ORF Transcript_33432/g.70354 Transcript_33432/m.70354 type:complete len:336 (-) Transcript_33432:428-1435(-)
MGTSVPENFGWRGVWRMNVASHILAAIFTAHTCRGLFAHTPQEAFHLLLANPLLGGDGTSDGGLHEDGHSEKGLPLWTYSLGYAIPGILISGAGNLLAHALFERDLVPREDSRAVFTNAYAMAGSAPLLAPLHKGLYERRFGYLYFDMYDHSLGLLLLSAALCLLVTETWFYWVHRAMHTPWLYKHVHAMHHSFNPSFTGAAASFHALDVAALALGAFVVPSLVPTHHATLSAFLFLNLIYTLLQHAATRTSWGCGVLMDANLHNIHHDYGMRPRNLGSLTCVWDRLLGTLEPKVPKWAETARREWREKAARERREEAAQSEGRAQTARFAANTA